MNKKSKKSVKDFKGQAMPKTEQKTVKGGNNNQNESSDFVILDDLLDG